MGQPLRDGSLPCGSTVQLFGKSGWSDRTLREYTQKESPGSDRQKDAVSVRQPAGTKKRHSTIFPIENICQDHFFSLVRPIPGRHLALSSVCDYLLSESCRVHR